MARNLVAALAALATAWSAAALSPIAASAAAKAAPAHAARPLTRQGFVAGAASLAAALPLAARADDAKTTSVKTKFGTAVDGKPLSSAKFDVPDRWVQLSGDVSGGRQLVLYADPDNSDTNAFVLITPVRGDYTSLGSFGSIEVVQATVMPFGDGIEYTGVTSEASTGKYTYDYEVSVPSQPKRHLKTVFMVVSDCIVTFNFQALAADYTPDVAKMGAAIVKSFGVGKA